MTNPGHDQRSLCTHRPWPHKDCLGATSLAGEEAAIPPAAVLRAGLAPVVHVTCKNATLQEVLEPGGVEKRVLHLWATSPACTRACCTRTKTTKLQKHHIMLA